MAILKKKKKREKKITTAWSWPKRIQLNKGQPGIKNGLPFPKYCQILEVLDMKLFVGQNLNGSKHVDIVETQNKDKKGKVPQLQKF